MKKLTFTLIAMFALSSCNSGGGGGSATPAKPLDEQLAEAKSATDFTASILPEKFTVLKANLSYEEQKEMYGVGCKTQGEPSWDPYKIDPSLHAGSTFKSKEGRSELLSLDTYQTLEKVIVSVEGQKVVTEVNFLDGSFAGTVFSSIDQIFTRKPHITTTSTYREGATDSDFSYVANYTQSALEYLQSVSSKDSYLSCSVSWDMSAPNKNSTDKISYLLNGRQIVAFLKKSTQVGEVTCTKRYYNQDSKSEEIKLGAGRKETIEIVSNDVVSESTVSCGGNEIFSMRKTALDSGKIISSEVKKALESPSR